LPTRPTELDAVAERRTETSDLIVESKAANKLIIAGPGTGKTYNFRRALEAVGGNGLALTFILRSSPTCSATSASRRR
jgi:hypothetical protein